MARNNYGDSTETPILDSAHSPTAQLFLSVAAQPELSVSLPKCTFHFMNKQSHNWPYFIQKYNFKRMAFILKGDLWLFESVSEGGEKN